LKTCSNCGHSFGDDDRFCARCGLPTNPSRPAPVPTAGDGASPAASARAGAKLMPYAKAVRRFWWVVALGLGLAAFLAIATVYRVSLFPPGLESREVQSYSSSARLLITSDQSSHLRSQITIFGPRQPVAPTDGEEDEGEGNQGTGEDQTEGNAEGEQGEGEAAGPSANAPPGQEVIGVTSPDSGGWLIRQANLFPLLIESDAVADYRRKEFGEIPGTVTARGIYSFSTANRYELSQIPVIVLDAVSSDPESAVALADATAKAFVGWTQERQNANKIPRQDRIVVQQLNAPKAAASGGGESKTMPVLVFLVVAGAFALLAILLDRLFPPTVRRPRADVEPIERPVKVKKSA
jgi:hypothetical protein